MLYLINVPQWTTSMPPVALTCLSGYFEEEKVPYRQVDLNIKLYNYIFSCDFCKQISKYLKIDKKELLDGTSIDYNEYLQNNIEKAVSIVKSKEKILVKEKMQWSNRIINNYLTMINDYLFPVKITLNTMSFGMENVNTYSKIIETLNTKEYDKLINIYKVILKKIYIEQDSLVGFSINNISQLINAIIITKIMQKYVKAHFFLGGSYLSANINTIIKCDSLFEIFDSICLYDGEHAIKNLYEHIKYGHDIKYKNIVFRQNRKIYAKSNYFIENIKELPAPSYKGIDFKEYFSPIKIISLPVSRGCYGNCTFCSYNHLASSKWREQSVGQIIREIKKCLDKYNSKFFFFSVATLSPQMAKMLSQRIIEENIEIYWASGIRMEAAFDSAVLELMGKAGCIRLDIGLESGSQETLNKMSKKVDSKYFSEIIFNMKRNGILPYLYIIKDFPTENLKQWSITLDFLNSVKKEILGFSCYEFFLSINTSIYNTPEEFGVKIYMNEEESEDIIEVIKSFQSENITIEEKKQKDLLLEQFYRKNRKKFIHYGNAYIDKDMPLSFPNQMLYITEKIGENDTLKIEMDKIYKIDKKAAILLDREGVFLKILSLKTNHKIIINKDMYTILEKENVFSKMVQIYCHSDNDKKVMIELYEMLVREGVLY